MFVEYFCATTLGGEIKMNINVNKDHRSTCTFISWEMVNMFVCRHPGPLGATDTTLDFTFVTLK